MAIKTSRSDLNQGQVNSVSDAVFGAGTGADINITSGGSNLPALAVNELFEVRDHSDSRNNGLYQVVTVTTSTSDYECDKVDGLAPVTASSEEITTLGATGASTEKSVYFDTARLHAYLLEQGNLDSDGVNGQAMWSFMMQEWKNDNFLMGNAPFPANMIDFDAGKMFMGQDVAGNNNGWNWEDNATFSIRSRKLLRFLGWDEIDAEGVTKARWACALSVDPVEDPANDLGFYQFGTDTTKDDTVDLTFPGPVNEAIQFFEEIGNPAGCDFATSSTITRSSGSFIDDGYVVGGQVSVRAATTSSNDGPHVLTGVAALTLTVSGTPFTTGADAAAILAVDNSNAFRLGMRVRDGDANGKTYAEDHTVTGTGAITVNNNTQVTFDKMRDNTEVRVYNASTKAEIAGIENATAGTADSRNFAWSAAAGLTVNYVIHNWNPSGTTYQTIRVEGFVVPNGDATFDIQQRIERNVA